MGQLTVRIDDSAIKYRAKVTKQRGIRMSHFDNEVYHFYMKYHPTVDTENTETEPKEET